MLLTLFGKLISEVMKSSGEKTKARMGPKPTLVGTVRIRTMDLGIYEKTKVSWKRSSMELPEAMHAIELFRAHGKLNALVDKNNPTFLKGQLSPGGKVRGARVNVLPDGRKLDKAFSLFAKHLTIHDESSNDHWDVLYQNPGGSFAHLYTLEKKSRFVRKKYREVEEFEKYYPMLRRKVLSALRDRSDPMAVRMYTLLETCMRVGNEIYYRAHGHKGLTTLKKKDISVDGNTVTFNYLSKGGVPMNVSKEFPDVYVERLNEILKPRKESDFVFVNEATGHPLSDVHFKEAFKRYCGREFYPHIVRSYYATEKANEFLRSHRTASRKEVLEFFRSVAMELGHKRFIKKKGVWKESYNITIHYYIQPKVLDKLNSLPNKCMAAGMGGG